MTEETTKETQSVIDIMSSFPSKEELLAENDGSSLPKITSQEEILKEPPPKKPSAADIAMNDLERKAAGKGIVEDTATGTPERTELEINAIERGWLPAEEFKGSPDNWVSAREFVDRSNMLDKISIQHKEMNSLKKSNEELARLLKKQISDVTEEKASKLIKLKEEALSEGEVEQAYEYETKYQEAKKELEGFKQVEMIAKEETRETNVPPEVKEFISRNPWLESNKAEDVAMREYAIRIEQDIEKQYPNWQLVTKLEEVERRVKQFFSDRFKRPGEKIISSVEAKTISPQKDPTKATYADLPPEARKYVDSFYKFGIKKVLSRDDYVQQLVDTGAIIL